MFIVKQPNLELPPVVPMKPYNGSYKSYCACNCFGIVISGIYSEGAGTFTGQAPIPTRYTAWDYPSDWGLPQDTGVRGKPYIGMVDRFSYYTKANLDISDSTSRRTQYEEQKPSTFNYLTYLKCEGSYIDTDTVCDPECHTETHTGSGCFYSEVGNLPIHSNTSAGPSSYSLDYSGRIYPSVLDYWALANFEANNLTLEQGEWLPYNTSFFIESVWKSWPRIPPEPPPDPFGLQQYLYCTIHGAKLYRFEFTPSPTGYLKVWVSVDKGSTSYLINNQGTENKYKEKIISYEFNTPMPTKNNSSWEDRIKTEPNKMTDFLEDPSEDSIFYERKYEYQVRGVEVHLIKYSFDPNYEPDITVYPPQQNGFPNPNWKPLPP